MNSEEDLYGIDGMAPEVSVPEVTESAFFQSMMKTDRSTEVIPYRRLNLLA